MPEKCDCCGAPIIRIDTVHGPMVCNHPAVHYWIVGADQTLVTPNGELIYAGLNGELRCANGLAYTLHTCPGTDDDAE